MEFPWMIEAKATIEEMLDENFKAPQAVLDDYKRFEFILNFDKKKQIKALLGDYDNKATVEELREHIKKFDDAYYEILNLTSDTVDFPIFRLLAANAKEYLSHQAEKIRNALLDAVYLYCQKSVEKINESVKDMQKRIQMDVKDEMELVDTRTFIKNSPNLERKHMENLDEVDRHYELLGEFSYIYDAIDTQKYWIQKKWPSEI